MNKGKLKKLKKNKEQFKRTIQKKKKERKNDGYKDKLKKEKTNIFKVIVEKEKEEKSYIGRK